MQELPDLGFLLDLDDHKVLFVQLSEVLVFFWRGRGSFLCFCWCFSGVFSQNSTWCFFFGIFGLGLSSTSLWSKKHHEETHQPTNLTTYLQHPKPSKNPSKNPAKKHPPTLPYLTFTFTFTLTLPLPLPYLPVLRCSTKHT